MSSMARLKKFVQYVSSNLLKDKCIVRYSSKSSESEIPRNLLRDVYSASDQPESGEIYDKKPFKYLCEADKTYMWCLCGKSKSQPFCDGTHKNVFLKVKQRPVRFKVPETKEYWLCNCKQTSNRPFCDGTHKRQDIQEKIKF
ncbi:CDGSH iron-sulfur domain-containing protein 3, mitochondrial [Orussus abietinus]|uniref:CDGSH iron-sulfur domain-containing protein 3, mitochondrial n=1 Tax=Orussus abietinus TaxID=222816 RepID=UPI000626D5B7|nr:CDGSH iron-sulfur domain-containing protein 3, mitochondrial [Orussus abietinus]